MAGQNQANLEMMTDLAQAKANAEMAHKTGVGSIFGGLGGAAGSMIAALA